MSKKYTVVDRLASQFRDWETLEDVDGYFQELKLVNKCQREVQREERRVKTYGNR